MKKSKGNKLSNTQTSATQSVGSPSIKQSSSLEPMERFPLDKMNFILMAISAGVIILGFILMAGGSSTETEFNPDIFSTRRIVVGPTIAFLGFLFMGFSIIYRGGSQKKNTEQTGE